MKKLVFLLWCATLIFTRLHASEDNSQVGDACRATVVEYIQNDYKVTLRLNSVSVSSLFDEIHRQTDLDFVYNTESLQIMPTISVTADNESVFSVLDRVFYNTDFVYKKSGNIIIINKKGEENKFMVTGKVIDDSGELLVGVTVQQKG